jgi:SPP1 gp7 family putative phage head morphogenesis protein
MSLLGAMIQLGVANGYLKAVDIEDERQAFAVDERDSAEEEAAAAIAAALLLMREAIITEGMTEEEVRQAPQKIRENEDELLAALVLLLVAASDIGVNASAGRLAESGLFQDTGQAAVTAQSRATQRAQTAVRQIVDTLTRLTREAIEAWSKSGLPLSSLIKRLDDVVFSRTRAEMIATTEGTNGFAIGGEEMARLSGVQIMEWYTMQDERVCNICRPMNGKRRYINGSYSPDLPVQSAPPAHQRCRCGEREIIPRRPANGG